MQHPAQWERAHRAGCRSFPKKILVHQFDSELIPTNESDGPAAMLYRSSALTGFTKDAKEFRLKLTESGFQYEL
jgi:hypothetical protein